MTAPREGLVAALDVGSSKVTCFIADTGGPRGVEILGLGVRSCRGLKAGAVVDAAETERAIRAAVEQAERMAGETVERVLVSLNAGRIASHTVEVEVEIDGHRVSGDDIDRVLSEAREAIAPEDRHIVHAFPVCFALDGVYGVKAPVGMYGDRLAVTLHVVTAAPGPLRNLAACVEEAHLAVSRFVIAPYAAGLATLVEDERRLGAAVIDMGGGTTGFAVFAGGAMVHAGVVPVGGGHVTQDIARGLLTPLDHAERLKTLHGEVLAAGACEGETIDVPQLGEGELDVDGCATLPRTALTGIIEPRLEETFELVHARLADAGFDAGASRRIVLTGGASQLPGVRDFAQRVLGKQLRLGRPRRVAGLADATTGPAFAGCAGLLLYALEAPAEAIAPRHAIHALPPARGLARVGRWLRENF